VTKRWGLYCRALAYSYWKGFVHCDLELVLVLREPLEEAVAEPVAVVLALLLAVVLVLALVEHAHENA
jgi:hypothetical protein